MNTLVALSVKFDSLEIKDIIERKHKIKPDVELMDIITVLQTNLQTHMDKCLAEFIDASDLSEFIEAK